MNKYIATFGAIAMLFAAGTCLEASPSSIGIEFSMKSITYDQAKSLVRRAALIWDVTESALWNDYRENVLVMEDLGDGYVNLQHEVHGSVILALEEGSF